MKGLKITLASWAPFIGGAEVAVERLALGLTEAGNDILLVVGTQGDALKRFREAGIRCEYVEQKFTDKWKWLQYRRSRNRLIEILRREQPDIVHSNDLPTHQMTSDAARRVKIPIICHHRWIFEQAAVDWLNKFGADQHLFVSKALMETLSSASPRLQASSRAVVYDGLSIPKLPIEHDRRASRQQLNLDPDRLIVLFAGQIIERKGVADLLQAWSRLEHWHHRAELVIVGDDLENKGAYRQEMELLARQIAPSARFVGFQKNVPDWLLASDVVMVPSHAEPLGNATLEAMAYARPVIGSNVGGIPEMVVDNDTGLLIPPKSPSDLASAIERILADKAMRERMGQAARQRCESLFSLDVHVQSVLAKYRDVLQKAVHR
jgi:glycosyltransferase involved in cell wall biosynthesis